MKSPELCEDMSEIRQCIDNIDKSIVELLSQRSAYVKKAAEFKKSIEDVKAPERVREIIATRKLWANNTGLSPDFIESLFRAIINYFISGEVKQWNQINSQCEEISIEEASIDDASQILGLQKRAFIQEAELINNYSIFPITQSLNEIISDFSKFTILKALQNDMIIGSARAQQIDSICYIGRVVVEPIFQNRGVGKLLMNAIESKFRSAKEFELFTGANSTRNIEFYSKLGYVKESCFEDPTGALLLKMRKKAN